MRKKRAPLFSLTLIGFISFIMMLVIPHATRAVGPTIDPWPSFRHDLLNSGVATDSGYPDTVNKLWMVDREDRSWGSGSAAGSRGPSVVDRGMVITAGTGVVQANDQFTGSLIWSKYLLWETPLTGIDADIPEPPEPLPTGATMTYLQLRETRAYATWQYG